MTRTAEQVKEAIIAQIAGSRQQNWLASPAQVNLVARALNNLFEDHDMANLLRHTIMRYLVGEDSAAKLTSGEASALISWAIVGDYAPNPDAVVEARLILDSVGVDRGQMRLL